MSNPTVRTSIAVLCLFIACASKPAHAGLVTYMVSVDTSAISGQNGNLDFQFNPGGSNAEGATVTVSSFQSIGGILSQPAVLTGDAAGSLPAALTLNNGTAYNDVFQGFAYGNSLQFNLTLSGQALDMPGGAFGSSFALSLYDAAGITPLLTTDPNGSVLTVNLAANAMTSAQTFPQSPTNDTPVAVAINAVPEPSSMLLVVSALPFMWIVFRCSRWRGSADSMPR